MDTEERTPATTEVAPPYACETDEVVAALPEVDAGLATAEATSQRASYGPNQFTASTAA